MLPVYSLSISTMSVAGLLHFCTVHLGDEALLDLGSIIPLDLIKRADMFFCQNLARLLSHPLLRVSTPAISFGRALGMSEGEKDVERNWRIPKDYSTVVQ